MAHWTDTRRHRESWPVGCALRALCSYLSCCRGYISVDSSGVAILWHVPRRRCTAHGRLAQVCFYGAARRRRLEAQLDLVTDGRSAQRSGARDRCTDFAAVRILGFVVPLHKIRHRRTIELMYLVLRLAKYAEMNFKHALCVRRPHEHSAQTSRDPNTDSRLPASGHSTEPMQSPECCTSYCRAPTRVATGGA